MTRAYIGLGSNLSNPVEQVTTALRELDKLENVRLVRASRLYRSVPMGPQEQPDYINAVAVLDTSLSPDALLLLLQGIEVFHQRIRSGNRWGPRTLDLDLLLFGDAIIDEKHLKVPHVGLVERSFVLVPLHEVAPDLVVSGLGAIADLMAACSMAVPEPLETA